MIDEQLEFQISQYADGSLPESERALVELRLLSSTEARDLLAEYQSLDASLKSAMPLPVVNWDRLANHLSDAVEEQRDARATTVLGRIGNWGRLAVAACVVLAVGGVALWTQSNGPSGTDSSIATSIPVPAPAVTTQVPPAGPAPAIIVRGPAAEAPTSPPVVVVIVGPSPSAKGDNWRVAEGVVTGPSRAVWIASGYDAAQDTERLPY